MFRRNINPLGILKKEVVIRVNKIKIGPCLSSGQVIALSEANKAAEDIFQGTYGITANGYLIELPCEKARLPHPCEELILDVGECIELVLLKSYLRLDFLSRKWFKHPSIHMYDSDGRMVRVKIDRFGIRLPIFSIVS